MQSRPGFPTTQPSPDVLIVGGGIVGSSIAYHLSLIGSRVLLLERDHLASGASGVAPGMLAAQVEAHYDDDFFNLALLGRAEHQPLAEALREEVGLDVECRATGILRVALDEAERVDLQRRMRWQTARGLRVEWIEPGELGKLEPLLAGVTGRLLAGGMWFPDERQVTSTRLVQGLAAASVKRGAQIAEGSSVVELETRGERIFAVRTSGGVITAGTVVLAAGVWSGELGRRAGLEIPVAPVKGQILTLRALQRAPRSVIWGGHCYLVPRPDGQVLLGATEEEGNYDPRPTLAGVGALSEAALEFLPWAGQLVVEGTRAGLRPAAPDRFPIIGRAPGLENLVLATGHFRNGVLLGPLTGRLVAQMIQDGVVAPEIAPFAPRRFQKLPTNAPS